MIGTPVKPAMFDWQVLAKLSGLEWRKVRRLADFQTRVKLPLSDCVELVAQLLQKSVYSKQEVCDLLGISVEDLDATSLSDRSRHGRSFMI